MHVGCLHSSELSYAVALHTYAGVDRGIFSYMCSNVYSEHFHKMRKYICRDGTAGGHTYVQKQSNPMPTSFLQRIGIFWLLCIFH